MISHIMPIVKRFPAVLKCGPMPTVNYTILATASSMQMHSAIRNQFASSTDKFFDSPYSLNDTQAPF
jgi:hypothetical protein